MYALYVLVAFSSFVSSWALILPDSVPLHKRQDITPGSPLYECHANCGGVIVDARTSGYCSDSTYKSQLSACLDCALTYDIWQYYGKDVAAAAKKCGDSGTPSPSSAVSTAASTTSVAAASTSSADTTTSTAVSETVSSSTVATSSAVAPSSTVASSSVAVSSASESSAGTSSSPVSSTSSIAVASPSSATPTGSSNSTATSSSAVAPKFTGAAAAGHINWNTFITVATAGYLLHLFH